MFLIWSQLFYADAVIWTFRPEMLADSFSDHSCSRLHEFFLGTATCSIIIVIIITIISIIISTASYNVDLREIRAFIFCHVLSETTIEYSLLLLITFSEMKSILTRYCRRLDTPR